MTTTDPFLAPRVADVLLWDRFPVALGGHEIDILAESDGDAVVAVSFGPMKSRISKAEVARRDPSALADVKEQLRAFAGGHLEVFDLPLRPSGTAFQVAVWRALMDIPFGSTRSYGEVASAIGRRGAARAVGSAVGSNPIGIVIPCHRVIGADGSLTGYGGGMDNKVALLTLEGVMGA
jgi:methylated-DNA-[protein]-cysteine S-methyltransferase